MLLCIVLESTCHAIIYQKCSYWEINQSDCGKVIDNPWSFFVSHRSWSHSKININFPLMLNIVVKKQIILNVVQRCVVCTLINNDISHHSGQNVVDSRGAGNNNFDLLTILLEVTL